VLIVCAVNSVTRKTTTGIAKPVNTNSGRSWMVTKKEKGKLIKSKTNAGIDFLLIQTMINRIFKLTIAQV